MRSNPEWLSGAPEFIAEFLERYRDRPIKDNRGGMGINHSFALYYALKKLSPDSVIESGVYKGQSTWIIEQALPQAEIYCIDPSPNQRVYTSKRAHYFTDDFAGLDWSGIDRANALCFFDDHQSALSRLKDMKWWGFKRAIFEDNYPLGQGDCYSIRKILSDAGHPFPNLSLKSRQSIRSFLGLLGIRSRHAGINGQISKASLDKIYWRQEIIRKPNTSDRRALEANLSVYCEFPPLVCTDSQRWQPELGWEGEYELTTKPIYTSIAENNSLRTCLESLDEEALASELSYTYICYAELT